VAAQTFLMIATPAVGWFSPRWPEPVQPILLAGGSLALIAGVALVAVSVLTLEGAFQPLLQPATNPALVDRGIYRRVRHPIYAGWMLVGLAAVLVTSPCAAVPLLLLVAELDGKRRVEERMLLRAVPGYVDYRRRVARAYLPGRACPRAGTPPGP
jgi:protein-S-isoprenylcysteine O-methyltransferase Ste14